MLTIQENVDLKALNTFGVRASARYYAKVESEDDLRALIDEPIYRANQKMVLGGGSNILFTRDYDGLIIHCQLQGHHLIDEDGVRVLVRGESGVTWHNFVTWALANDWGGIENLSLIPGTVGAAPIQNIGAYGVELADVVHEVRTIDLATGEVKVFDRQACRFGYRDSVFKKELKGKIFISSVTLTLSKIDHPLFTAYGSIRETLARQNITSPTIQDVSRAVIEIRQSKLPDPKEIGNAGSFFKNPTITYDQYTLLQKQYNNIPGYPIDDQCIKIPAGWLIEQCGWKGKRINEVGVHAHQALVLVNHGQAEGAEVLALASKILESVKSTFGIALSPEVNIV